MSIDEIEQEFLKLTGPERKEVLRRLVADLEECRDEKAEGVWLEEAQRRYQELKMDMVEPVPAEQATSKARERLRNVR